MRSYPVDSSTIAACNGELDKELDFASLRMLEIPPPSSLPPSVFRSLTLPHLSLYLFLPQRVAAPCALLSPAGCDDAHPPAPLHGCCPLFPVPGLRYWHRGGSGPGPN